MMESHLFEAVRNNILGTWNLVRTARRHNVRSLLMISSDKAVNPIADGCHQARLRTNRIRSTPVVGETKCVSVRFGNVLGSNGALCRSSSSRLPSAVDQSDAPRCAPLLHDDFEAVARTVHASTMGEGRKSSS
jgi:nucleoside-diphosphate-sugar epimerase